MSPFAYFLQLFWSFSRLTALRLLERALLFLRRQAWSAREIHRNILKKPGNRNTGQRLISLAIAALLLSGCSATAEWLGVRLLYDTVEAPAELQLMDVAYYDGDSSDPVKASPRPLPA